MALSVTIRYLPEGTPLPSFQELQDLEGKHTDEARLLFHQTLKRRQEGRESVFFLLFQPPHKIVAQHHRKFPNTLGAQGQTSMQGKSGTVGQVRG